MARKSSRDYVKDSDTEHIFNIVKLGQGKSLKGMEVETEPTPIKKEVYLVEYGEEEEFIDFKARSRTKCGCVSLRVRKAYESKWDAHSLSVYVCRHHLLSGQWPNKITFLKKEKNAVHTAGKKAGVTERGRPRKSG